MVAGCAVRDLRESRRTTDAPLTHCLGQPLQRVVHRGARHDGGGALLQDVPVSRGERPRRRAAGARPGCAPPPTLPAPRAPRGGGRAARRRPPSARRAGAARRSRVADEQREQLARPLHGTVLLLVRHLRLPYGTFVGIAYGTPRSPTRLPSLLP